MTDLDERPAGPGGSHAFPRTDLPPLRHQQVRSVLVREAGPAPRRGARVRRLAPAVAAVAVLGVTGAALVPGTPLGRRIGAVVAAVTGQDDVVCGGVRAPRADDDTSAVRYLPAGLAVSSVTLGISGMCVGYTDPAVPTPVGDPWDTDPVWTAVRTQGQVVRATITLWRSLPPGISADVADGRSVRAATDGGDPGTVLDPPFRRVPLRGVTGTLVPRAAGSADASSVVTWTEPGGRRWSVTGKGITDDDLLAFAEALDLTDGVGRPGVTAAVPAVVTPGQAATAYVAPPYWLRLDVPAAARHDRPDRLTAVEAPQLRATFTGAGHTYTWEANPLAMPWQADLGVGDRLVTVDLDTPAVVGRPAADGTAAGLVWSLPSGVTASLTATPGAKETDLLDLVASVTAVPAGDPRLASSAPSPEPGIRPDGSTPGP